MDPEEEPPPLVPAGSGREIPPPPPPVALGEVLPMEPLVPEEAPPLPLTSQ